MCPVDLILPTAAGCRAPAVAAGSPHRTVAVDFSVACCLCPLAPLGSFSRLHYLRRCQVIPLPHTSICESSHGFMISCKVQLACRLRMHKLGHPSMSLSRQGPYLTSLCPEGASASNATTSSIHRNLLRILARVERSLPTAEASPPGRPIRPARV
jgi:hypothetical protein